MNQLKWCEASSSLNRGSIRLKGGKKHNMSIGFIFVNYPPKHSLENFFNGLNLTPSLGIVRLRLFVIETKLRC